MSVSLTPVITTAGLQTVLNATNDGLQARITHVAFGDGAWQPTPSAAKLANERRRVTISRGRRLQPTQIHITAVDDGELNYWVRELGFYLDDGTLLAVWSDPDQALAWKAAGIDLLVAFDMVLSALPADSVVVDGTGTLDLAPATVADEGVVRLATPTEATAGTIDTAVVMTPLSTRTHGDARYSAQNHAHNWTDIRSKPNTFPASSHRHPWSQIDGKPSVYRPSTHTHDSLYIRQTNLRTTSGFVRTNNRYSKSGWAGYSDWTRNYVDVYPPSGYTMSHFLGFTASLGAIFFSGKVDDNDIVYCRWRRESTRIRVIANSAENRSYSYINYLAIWRR